MAKAGEIWQKITQQMMMSKSMKPSLGHTDPLSFAESMLHVSRNMSVDPINLIESQIGLVADHMNLMKNTTEKLLGNEVETPYVVESPRDRRFKDAAWQDSTVFDYIKQSYLINSRWLQDTVGQVKGLDRHTAHKLNFFTRQFIDAMSPSNYAFTNPEVMRTTIESNGDNVVRGLGKLLEDIDADGKLRIRMSDDKAFTFGKDIAATPGKVVFQNDLMQLIQFAATTKQVNETPILITPAWINKYYILDLKPENSLIGWLVKQGHTVFVISWVNPDENLGRKRFDDYLLEGPLAALNVVENITGSKKTSLVGYCLGGTLTAIALSYLRTHGQSNRVASATYLTTLVDFTEAGDMSVFIDDMQLDSLEERMSEQGFLDAADMATTFNMLRSNDLIWSFVVNNYLLGKDPFPFDLLYWNSDSTRMPATMHAFYLRNMYQNNMLVKPNGIELADTPINLSKITTPSYILATKDDHIAPWMSAYAATQVYDGPVKFTLADSGHIAGVVNHPGKNKYCWWDNTKFPPKSGDWFNDAKRHDGSWWGDWNSWLKQYAGKKVAARALGNKKYKPIEAAPGSYAKVR